MKRAAVWPFLLLTLAPAARANSVASVVVLRNGDVVFSDYVRNRIWRVDRAGKLSVLVAGKHTHHLVLDGRGNLYGEHVPMHGGAANIWMLPPDGSLDDVFQATPRGHATSYRGTVFAIGGGDLYYLQDCQIVRVASDGGLTVMAGQPCPGAVRENATVRYGHLHGSLAWGPGGVLFFSDARTIRRAAKNGDVTTLGGKPATLFGDPQPDERRFDRLMGLAVDEEGVVYAAERGRREVIRIGPDGKPVTVARLPALRSPSGLAVSGGDVYVVSELSVALPRFLAGLGGNPTVHKIPADGRITRLATVR